MFVYPVILQHLTLVAPCSSGTAQCLLHCILVERQANLFFLFFIQLNQNIGQISTFHLILITRCSFMQDKGTVFKVMVDVYVHIVTCELANMPLWGTQVISVRPSCIPFLVTDYLSTAVVVCTCICLVCFITHTEILALLFVSQLFTGMAVVIYN